MEVVAHSPERHDEPDRLRLAPLDGLRAVAVVLVFLAHSIGDRVPGGFVGVDIFFVLSGYLITGLLVREWETFATVDLRAFYVRRALRLYPALIVALIGVAAITPLVGYGWPHYFLDAGAALAYVYNFWELHDPGTLIGHFWSLSVEEQYYIFWPLLLVAFLRRSIRAAIRGTAIATAAAFVVQVALYPWLGGRIYFLPFGHANELLIGSLFAIVIATRRVSRLRLLLGSWPLAWAAWIPIAVVALRAKHIQSAWLYEGGLAGLAICSCVIVGHLVTRGSDSVMGGILGSRPAAWLGKRSYAFYLFHQPVITVLRHYHLHYRYLLPLGFLIATALVWASFALVERPALMLKRRWERWGSPRELAPGQLVATGIEDNAG